MGAVGSAFIAGHFLSEPRSNLLPQPAVGGSAAPLSVRILISPVPRTVPFTTYGGFFQLTPRRQIVIAATPGGVSLYELSRSLTIKGSGPARAAC